MNEPEAAKTSKGVWVAFWLIAAFAGVVGAGFVLSLLSGPDQCPTVTGDSLDIPYDMERSIDAALQERLHDPGSYQRDGISTQRRLLQLRADGTQYATRVTVRHRARNAFGGMVQGTAQVSLRETEETGCQVTNVAFE